MKARNEILIGVDSRYNDMTMYRKVNNVPFNPQYFFDSTDELMDTSNVVVNYIEYYKNNQGIVIDELTKYKCYVVANVDGWAAANNWFFSLASTPISATNGVINQIEDTLQALPINVVNGYILQQPL